MHSLETILSCDYHIQLLLAEIEGEDMMQLTNTMVRVGIVVYPDNTIW